MSVVSQLLSNFKPFSGDGDLDTFLKKYDTICVMQQWDDPTKARNLGLFLEERAWQVYDDLSEEEKKNYLVVQKTLQKTFSKSAFGSYTAFVKRSLIQESVAFQIGSSNVDPKVMDTLLMCQFLNGLKEEYSRQLRVLSDVNSFDTALAKAKQLINVDRDMRDVPSFSQTPSSSTPLVKEEIAAVGHRNSKKQGRQSSSSRQNGDPSSRYANYVCHECKQRGHIRWFCPLRKNKQQPKSGNADKGQGKSALR
ncbi:hypothetical protein FOZ60_000330 [Perkinsus olseni]|uniref:CCHC-type domain-containing protein n=1 Tax=Perkinsus olseni TaxID=32597 RepID=A0A7J6P3N0_PEROL|nr:hypothetical protein FOZ60_000330 [Perkinsus olseni]